MQQPPPDNDQQADQPLANQPATIGPLARPVFQLARRVWNPVPIQKPVISTDLEDLPWPERSAEVVRHALLSVEHWLSRGGWIRESDLRASRERHACHVTQRRHHHAPNE